MNDLVIKEGYLYKESKHLKVFRKRWIVLKGNCLYSYKSKQISHIIQHYTDKIDLALFKHITINTTALKFELISKHNSRCFIVSSIHDLTDWIKQIKCTINNDINIHNHLTTNEGESHENNSKSTLTVPTNAASQTNGTKTNVNEQKIDNIKVVSKSDIHITAYWEGYTEQGCSYPLNEVPEHVNTIPIAFIQPVKDPKSTSPLATTWDFDDQFVYKNEDIKQWIKEINDRGTNQRVLLSILDTPTCHWYPDVDIDAFAKNIASDCDDWGIGGVDVDAESGMSSADTQYVKTFVALIKALKKYLSAGKIITYTCYTESQWDTDIIKQCKDDIAYINTMAYWGGKDAQISLYNHYVNDIGDMSKVGIGVKAGNGGDSTGLDTVQQCAEWMRDNNEINTKRMMLWSLTRDVKQITNRDDGTYLDTIYTNILPQNVMMKLNDNELVIQTNGKGQINIIQNITINNYNSVCTIM